MNVLFTRFPLESTLGGAEIQTLSLMKGLSERDHDVSFLGSCPVLLSKVESGKWKVESLDIGPPPVTKWNLMSFLWRGKKMQKALTDAVLRSAQNDILPDVIFMLSLSEKLLLTEPAVAKGIKVFWMEHDRVGSWLRKNPWLGKLRRLSEKVTTVCVSEMSRKIYVDMGWDPKKVVAIPNGIDLGRFAAGGGPHPQPFSHGEKGAGTLKIGCIARLSPEKGIDVLIKAIGGLPDITLTIVGTGPEKSKLQSLIQKTIQPYNHSTISRIKILPTVADVSDFYTAIDVLVLPSRDNDPFGLVAAEAMACGTPVIVTDQCGIAGYLRDGHDAILCRADSDLALKEAILQSMDASLRKRMSANGRVTAERMFSLTSMIDAYEKLVMDKACP